MNSISNSLVFNTSSSKKITTKDFQSLERVLLNIARSSCPYDTGNMAGNAIYSIKTKNGFKIVWDQKFAYYLGYVNEGLHPINPISPKVIYNKGFVDRSIGIMSGYTFNFLGMKTYSKTFGRENNKNFIKMRNMDTPNAKNLGPLFLLQAHEIYKGNTNVIMDNQTRRAMTNMYKSVTKYLATDKIYMHTINNFDIEYDIENNEVYEIDTDGYYLRDKN